HNRDALGARFLRLHGFPYHYGWSHIRRRVVPSLQDPPPEYIPATNGRQGRRALIPAGRSHRGSIRVSRWVCDTYTQPLTNGKRLAIISGEQCRVDPASEAKMT